MKLLLLFILPLAITNPVDKRFLLDTLQTLGSSALTGLLEGMGMNLTTIKSVVTDLAVTLETDPTESKCEGACPGVVDQVLSGDPANTLHLIVHSGCPLICRSLQSLVHLFNINVLHVTPAK